VGISQNQHAVDSLTTNLKDCTADSTFINTHMDLCGEFLFNNPDSALVYAKKSFVRAKQIKDTANIAECYNVFGIAGTMQGKYLTGLENFQQSLHWYRLIDNKRGIASIVNNIGVIYGYMDNYDESIKHYRESYNISLELEDYNGAALNLFNIATDFLEVQKYDSSKHYVLVLEEFQNLHEQYISPAPIKGELFLNEEQADSARKWFEIGRKESLAEEDFHQLTSCLAGLAEVDMLESNFENALGHLKEVEDISLANEFNESLLDVYDLKSQIYSSQLNYELALDSKEQYLNLRSELDSLNNFNRVSELNAKYETEKRDRELAEITAQMAAGEANKKARDRVLLITGLCVLFVIGMMLFSIIRKRRTNRILNNQNSQILLQRQKILASINYAKKIQNSILIPEERIRTHLPESFIYFRPKDIVSGDFYWFEQIGEKLLIATVDCTGHGVPGAFMSLIANNKLNKVVNEKGIHEPSQVLAEVHKEIVYSLNQETGLDNSQDGMDMSLCVIDRSKNSIEFAGAQNPIFIVKEGKVHEIKADSLSLGGTILSKKLNGAFHFSTKKIQFEAGNMLFMFTDGFVDQFGGAENKKLNKSLFKNLILETYEQNIEHAKTKLETFFQTWRGENPQIDDVLIIGARL
jgi:serine phosphatase RsbU (regulator of sigma subunit)